MRKSLALIGAIVLGTALARAQAPETVQIGFASPLTGSQAHYGKDNQNGAQMAIDDQQGAALGRYATQTLRLKRFAVIDDRTAYGQGLAEAFIDTIRAAKAQVVKREFTNDKAVDFRSILTSIRSQAPEAIFFGGYDAQAGPMARQMKELGLNIALLGGETMNTAKFIQLAGPAAEGHVASTPGAALESRVQGRMFALRYRERYQQDIGLYAPYFYDSVMVIAAAMQQAGSTVPKKVLPVLRNIRHSGVTAEIAFDDSGELRQGLLSIFKVRNGKWVLQ
jgi:branched-chain amino acid transport system substrate-binding protein